MTGSLDAAVGVGTSLPAGNAGQVYNATLTPSGGTSPYTHVISSGSLPPGLALSPGGVLAGIPQTAGQFAFAVQSTDATGAIGVTNLTLSVTSATGLQINTASLPSGMMGTAYDTTLTAQGGTSPYSFDLVMGGGALPAGLTLTAAGRISGAPTAAGVFPLTVRVTDAIGNSAQAALSLRVEATTLTLSTTSLAGVSTNLPYSQPIIAVGGTGPYTYTVATGTLPTGLTLSPAGLITGTAATAGTSNFAVQVTDSAAATKQANYSLVVTASTPQIVTTTLPNAIVNQPFTASLLAQGGTSPYTFSVVTGPLPAGLTLSPTGTLAGTPTVAGASRVTVKVTDASGATGQSEILVNVNSGNFSISNVTLPDGLTNTPFTTNLTTTGGTAPYAFQVSSGTPPPGIVLNPNGTLAGVPTTAGTYSFVLAATDAASQAAQLPVTLRVQSSALTIPSNALANGQVSQPYTSTLARSNGTAPYVFALASGALPPGLNLNQNGNISGTPTTIGSYQATLRVTDAAAATAEASVTIVITGNSSAPPTGTPLSFVTLTLPSARQNQAFNANLQATGGTTPYAFALASGTLPTGVTLSPAGLLSGTPTGTSAPPFAVQVTDSAGATALATYFFNINASALALSSGVPNSGQVGQAYTFTYTSTGGAGATTYTVDGGALPTGLTLNPNGTLSGTPTAAGTFVFNLRATDTSQVSSLFSQAITVGTTGLGFSSNQLPDAAVGTAYAASFTGVGGTAPYTFALVSGTLPPGLTLAPTGAVTGTPTTAGSYPVTLSITDSTTATATTAVTFTVKAVSGITFVSTALPTANSGTAYSYALAVTGGQAPYSYSLAPGSTLPAGINLSAAGVLSGITLAGGSTTFTVSVNDATGATNQQALTLTVGSSLMNIPNASLPVGTVGTAYDFTLSPTGGTAPYTVSLAGGTLPAGVTLSAAGVFTGTPTAAGAYPIVIRVIDASGVTLQQAFTLYTVAQGGLIFSTPALPATSFGHAYQANLQATGGTAPYTFTVVSGGLVPGLNLASNGTVSGISASVGQFTATVRVVDANGASAETTVTMVSTQ